jgi:glucan 1,3-beta-glucosidase
LGGLFVLEPFISPALFQAYPGVRDEWDLTTAVSASGNLTDFLVQHYSTFITEEDIAQIAGAGLNWIRLPIPFWAIEKWDDIGSDNAPSGPEISEPFLARVCWQYILRVLEWARKYGIRVNLDLHTIPGSQNGVWADIWYL